MTVQELYNHFLDNAPWVTPDATADQIEVGDPNRPVTRIATAWSACTANLEAAAEDGCDLFITHEPCFCEFWEPQANFRETAWGRKRTAILNGAGMSMFSLHDTWDSWPRYGIRDSWMRFLGLDEPRLFRDYRDQPNQWLSLHDIARTTLSEYAASVARRLSELGADGVTIMGDPDAPVSSVAIGVGCGIPTFEMLELGADVLVQVYDRAFQTFIRLPLLDLGANLIVVEHHLAETVGMRGLADYLSVTFPDLPVSWYNEEPRSRFVPAPTGW